MIVNPIYDAYDVVIVGAGPGGAMTGTLIGLLNQEIKVCILDTRETTRRHYGLSLSPDSINEITTMLREKITTSGREQAVKISSFMSFLNSWKSTVQRASVIEDELAAKAHEAGITVLRKEMYKHVLTEENLHNLLDSSESSIEGNEHAQIHRELSGIFKNAKVIIGGDGRHSIVRKNVMGADDEALVDRANLEYFIEIKYDTLEQTKRRNYLEITSASKCEGIAFETMGRERTSPDTQEETEKGQMKPATMHFLVGKTTYEAFASAVNRTEWSLEKLAEMAKEDPIIEKQREKIEHYLEGVRARNGSVENAKIKRLPIDIYRSVKAVEMHKERVVALVGDAFSGAVLARGVNKAFREASHLAVAVSNYFDKLRRKDIIAEKNAAPEPSEKENLPLQEEMNTSFTYGQMQYFCSDKIPEDFQKYQIVANAIFAEEKKWAEIKIFCLKSLRFSLRMAAKPLHWMSSATVSSFQFVQNKIYGMSASTT